MFNILKLLEEDGQELQYSVFGKKIYTFVRTQKFETILLHITINDWKGKCRKQRKEIEKKSLIVYILANLHSQYHIEFLARLAIRTMIIKLDTIGFQSIHGWSYNWMNWRILTNFQQVTNKLCVTCIRYLKIN